MQGLLGGKEGLEQKYSLVGNGAGVWSFIHTDDAAYATQLAIEHGPQVTSQTIIVWATTSRTIVPTGAYEANVNIRTSRLQLSCTCQLDFSCPPRILGS
jgi:hypothetical protein